MLTELWFFKFLKDNSVGLIIKKNIEINLSLGPAGHVGITFVALAGILTELWPFEV